MHEKPIHNYKDARMIGEGLFQITDEQYQVSRNNRIKELTLNLNEQEIDEIEDSIPKKNSKIRL